MSTNIHPTADVAATAELADGVAVGPYSIIGPDVRIDEGTRIGPHVVISGVTKIGKNNSIVGQASIGAEPQDFSYRGEPTEVVIGDGNMIREFVSINRGTQKGGAITRVGNDCLLMACSHIAHDCQVEDNVILANNVMLAGHALIGKGANVSGAVGVHHFVTIGAYAYIGGMTRVERDIPPYMIVEGRHARVRNVNIIGLQRAGFSEEDIEELRMAHRRIFRSREPQSQAIESLRDAQDTGDIVRGLIEAMDRAEQGRKGRYREALREEFGKQGAARLAAGARS